MMMKRFFATILMALSALLFCAELQIAKAQNSSPSALEGHVTSQDEGPMEGVLVSAKKDGSTITITVVSDDTGRYAFPSSKLGAGRYSLSIRAVGYELDSPNTVDVTSGTATTADIKLRPTNNLAAHRVSDK